MSFFQGLLEHELIVGFIVENILPLWGQLEQTACHHNLEKSQNIKYYTFSIVCRVISSFAKVGNFCKSLFRWRKLPGHPDILGGWEQAPFMPLLYIEAVRGKSPLWKPRLAVMSVCLSEYMKDSIVTVLPHGLSRGNLQCSVAILTLYLQ